MATTKPDVNEVWASTAAEKDIFNPDTGGGGGGDSPVLPPIPGKTELGWVTTDVPPHAYFNFEQNRQGAFNKHVNIEGIPVWDAGTPYIENSFQKDPDDGRIYRSTFGTESNPNLGFKPSDNLDKWKKQIETELEVVVTPTAVSPTSGAEVVTTTPTLVSSAFRTILNVPHSASEYRVATNATMTELIALSGTLGAVEQWVVTPALATGDDFYWDVRYQNSDGTWSERSTPAAFTIPDAAVQTPTNLLPVNLDSSVTDQVTLTADAFLSTPISGHEASQWLLSKVSDFSVIAIDSGEDTVNLTSFSTSVDLNLTDYYWKVRYKSDTLGWSPYSTATVFTTVAETVQKPTNVTPANGALDVGGSVQLTGDQFTAIPAANENHAASQWQVGNSDFSVIYFDSGTDAVNLESINATGYPEGTTTVYWRVRYQGDVTGFSAWSTPTTFTTKAVFADWLNWNGARGVDTVVDSAHNPNSTSARNFAMDALSDSRVIYAWNESSSFQYYIAVSDINGLAVSVPLNNEANRGGVDAVQTSITALSDQKAAVLFRKDGTGGMSLYAVDVVGDTPVWGNAVTLESSGLDQTFMNSVVVALNSTFAVVLSTESSFKARIHVVDMSQATPQVISTTVMTTPSGNNIYTMSLSSMEDDNMLVCVKDTVTDQVQLRILDFNPVTGSFVQGSAVNSATLTQTGSSQISASSAGDGNIVWVAHDNGFLETGRFTYSGTLLAPQGTDITASTTNGNQLQLANPIVGQIVSLRGDLNLLGTVDITPIDPTLPNLEGTESIAGKRTTWSDFAVLDESRIAVAWYADTSTLTITILDGAG